jgi:hypothetical protein
MPKKKSKQSRDFKKNEQSYEKLVESLSNAGSGLRSTEFVPTSVNAVQEELPELDTAFGGHDNPTKAHIEAEKQAALKGKPSQFFKHEGFVS